MRLLHEIYYHKFTDAIKSKYTMINNSKNHAGSVLVSKKRKNYSIFITQY